MTAQVGSDASTPIEPSRILIVHERYALRAGEDAAVDSDLDLLRTHGHDVASWLVDNAEIASWPLMRRLSLAWRTTWNTRSGRTLLELAWLAAPGLVHFHNTLPVISPAAIRAAHRAGFPVVFTVHNYRLLCPAGEYFRAGRPCEECRESSLLKGILHGCYRQSSAQTAAVAAMLTAHRALGTWDRCVDAFITPTEFLKAKLIEGGLDGSRIHVRPNAVEPLVSGPAERGNYALFAGRLIADKGILTLLDAMAACPGVKLRIIGEGGLEAEVRRRAAASGGAIEYAGQLGRQDAARLISAARALVYPSLAYETFGLTMVEALAHGVPVIASRLGSRGEIIQDGQEGLLFTPGDAQELAATINRVMSDDQLRDALGARARARYNTHFTPERSYARLMEIYGMAMESARARRAA